MSGDAWQNGQRDGQSVPDRAERREPDASSLIRIAVRRDFRDPADVSRILRMIAREPSRQTLFDDLVSRYLECRQVPPSLHVAVRRAFARRLDWLTGRSARLSADAE